MSALKKTVKYFLVAILNLTVLTALLACWTDKLELTFNDIVLPLEFLKILGFTFLSLIGMRLLVFYFKKKNVQEIRTKLKAAALVTLLISSYLYIDYSIKCVKNCIVDRKFRNQIVQKIKQEHRLNGTSAAHLTNKEYVEITKINWFPKLPAEATNIAYYYDYDGFLPDHLFTLTYDLPQEMKVDTFNYKHNEFSQSRTFEMIDGIKRVTYTENEW